MKRRLLCEAVIFRNKGKWSVYVWDAITGIYVFTKAQQRLHRRRRGFLNFVQKVSLYTMSTLTQQQISLHCADFARKKERRPARHAMIYEAQGTLRN